MFTFWKKNITIKKEKDAFYKYFAIVYLHGFFFELLVVKRYFWVFVQCLLINTFHYCLECSKHFLYMLCASIIWACKFNHVYFKFTVYWYEISLVCKMQLEDDVIAKPGYFSIMKTFAEQQSSSTWVLLEFSTLGFIGMFEMYGFSFKLWLNFLKLHNQMFEVEYPSDIREIT